MQTARRLDPRGWSDSAWGWLGPIGVALLAFTVRIWNVGQQKKFLFDETYYAKDAYSLLQHGYVQDFEKNANAKIVAGDLTDLMTGQPSWVVHPEGGRWLIAIGEQLFGLNSFGWRVSAVVVGALTVLILARLVRRLTGSTLIGCFAGLLLTVDGTHFVMSRLALLDIFLAFWLVAAVACLVVDHDRAVETVGRRPFFRPWQLAAGICFGMACASKWSGIYPLATFGLLVVLWEVWSRRAGWRGLLWAGVPAFLWIVIVAFVVYLTTWTGWLLHHEVYEARFGFGYGDYSKPWGAYLDRPPSNVFVEIGDALRSLWHFHVMTYDFHTRSLDNATHPYQSNPLGWLVLERPVGVDAQNGLPIGPCGAPEGSSCMRVITILGNPAVWWLGSGATLVGAMRWAVTRDGRWAVPVLGVLSCWLPWFLNDDRPIFSFYAVTIVPFLTISTSMILAEAYRSVRTARGRYLVGLVGVVVAAAAVGLFCYFYPILTDRLVPYDTWYSRMWFPRWI